MTAQLDIFLASKSASVIAAESRRTGLLPLVSETEHLSEAERMLVAQEWIAGAREIGEQQRQEARAEFAARGWPFAWLLETDHPKAEALDEAVEVVDRYYTPELIDGAQETASMGIAQHKGFGGCEGVAIKREVYGDRWLVSIYCVTGPCNMEARGKVEFEPGAKSHIFHLFYATLPDARTLAGDVAAHPIITGANNRKTDRKSIWMGEGWTGSHASRPRTHVPWTLIAAAAVEGLLSGTPVALPLLISQRAAA